MSSLIPYVESGSTPDRLARAAVELFIQRGFQATSVDDIVAKAGRTKPTFYYYYYSSKLGLLHALLDNSLSSIERSLHTQDRPELEPPVRLMNLLRAYALEVCDRPQLWTLYFSERKIIDPEVMAGWRQRERGMVAVLERTIAEGIAQGHFKSGEPLVYAMAAMGMAGWLHHWFRRDSGLSAEEIAQSIAEMACDGLCISQLVPDARTETATSRRG